MPATSTSGAAASRPSACGSATSRRSREAARTGLFDIMAHPDLVKVWGEQRPRARGRPTALLRAGGGGVPRRRRGGRGLDRRAAQARRRDLPLARLPGDGRRRRHRRSRCPATPTCPGSSATATRRPWRCSRSVGIRELCVFEGRRAPHGADRLMARTGPRRRLAPLRGGAPAAARRRRDRRTTAASPATPTPTCSPTRSSTRCSARPGSATSASTSPTPTSLEGRGLDGAAAHGRRAARRGGLARRARGRDGHARAPEAGRPPRRDPRVAGQRRSAAST